MFYVDDYLIKYESDCSWDKALMYLEDLFTKQPNVKVLNALIGFSWYYLTEGPVISRQYENDENILALGFWKKYLSIGLAQYKDLPEFCFIAGYTLILDGFYIDKQSKDIGLDLLKTAANTTDPNLAQLTFSIIELERHNDYQPLNVNAKVLDTLFSHGSLLENYFKELFS
jgi:hypothetical protein